MWGSKLNAYSWKHVLSGNKVQNEEENKTFGCQWQSLWREQEEKFKKETRETFQAQDEDAEG